MVIDTAAETVNGTPVILYNTTDADLTDEVLKELNAAAPAMDTAKPDEKKDEKSGKKDQKKK
jgi:dihydrodipicolinate synthase/N-acetylneuraminate lyase